MGLSLAKDSFLALAAVAWADGTLDKAEGEALARVAREAGLPPADVAEIEQATRAPVSLERLDATRLPRAERVLVYALATWLARLDNVVTPEEKDSLARLGKRLELPDGIRTRASAAAFEVAALPDGDRPARFDFSALKSRLVAKLGNVEAELARGQRAARAGMVSIVTAYRDLVRLREIYVVLVKHGFGELASRLGLSGRRKTPKERPQKPAGAESEPPPASARGGDLELEASPEDVAQGEEEQKKVSLAVRVRLVAQDLGPSFVKLGQIVSTRTDVLSPELVVELKKLQDAVPPVSFEEVKRQVETQLARPLDEVYESFDERPLAAASIGQVHRARLRTPDGPKDVVVKVQRPGVAQTIARDLELLHTLAALIERTIPEAHVYSPRAMVENFDRSITAELDYTIEAENTRRFAKNFEGHGEVHFPRVYAEASARQVLTLEFLPGQKVYDAIKSGHSGPEMARTMVRIIIKQIFEDGYFHADPHPGNIIIMGEPGRSVIGLIDLGMVGRLSPDMRDKTIDLMLAAVRQDSLAVADALYAIGTPTRKVDMRAYRAEASMLAEKYLGRQLKEIELSKLIRDLVQGAAKYGIEIPADFLMVGKALMTLEGVGKEIDPDLDVFTETKPYFVELLRKRYSPERVLNEVWRGLERLSGVAYDLPQQTREILEDLRLGRLQMKTSNPDLPPALDRLGRRGFSGLLVAALTVGGAQLVQHEKTVILGYVLLGLGAVALVAHLARDVRQ